MASGSSNRSNKKKGEQKTPLKQRITEVLELPKEIVLNVPKLTMVGNSDIIIENYRGVMEYDGTRIRISTGIGVIRLTGERLVIKEITSEEILVCGEIASLEFLK
jgi:sporulation protein YqfC